MTFLKPASKTLLGALTVITD